MSDRTRRFVGRALNNAALFVVILAVMFWLYALYQIVKFFLTFP